jgi:hypothetical protein
LSHYIISIRDEYTFSDRLVDNRFNHTGLGIYKTRPLVLRLLTDIDLQIVKENITANDLVAIEHWMNDQKWYSHDSGIPHIKLFWLHVFNKKRPAIIANYIIPSENEMIAILAQNTGISVVWDCNVASKIRNKELQLVWDSPKMPATPVFLLSGKNDNLSAIAEEIAIVVKEVLE